MRFMAIILACVLVGAGPATKPTTQPAEDRLIASLRNDNASLRQRLEDAESRPTSLPGIVGRAMQVKVGMRRADVVKAMRSEPTRSKKEFTADHQTEWARWAYNESQPDAVVVELVDGVAKRITIKVTVGE